MSHLRGGGWITPNVSLIANDNVVKYQEYIAPPISLCDIAYWDGSKVKTIAKDKYTTSLGTAIGVVVIPEGMLPDGKARIMGLKPVDANGNASDSNGYMTWSVYSTDTSLTNYTNALSDFNGLSNTEVLVGLGSDYEAANAAWKYKDAANSTVQWYLPAAGELGFLIPRFNEINSAITGVGGVAVGSSYGFWSSSEYSLGRAYALYTDNGVIDNGDKDYHYSVRVFGVV